MKFYSAFILYFIEFILQARCSNYIKPEKSKNISLIATIDTDYDEYKNQIDKYTMNIVEFLSNLKTLFNSQQFEEIIKENKCLWTIHLDDSEPIKIDILTLYNFVNQDRNLDIGKNILISEIFNLLYGLKKILKNKINEGISKKPSKSFGLIIPVISSRFQTIIENALIKNSAEIFADSNLLHHFVSDWKNVKDKRLNKLKTFIFQLSLCMSCNLLDETDAIIIDNAFELLIELYIIDLLFFKEIVNGETKSYKIQCSKPTYIIFSYIESETEEKLEIAYIYQLIQKFTSVDLAKTSEIESENPLISNPTFLE